MHGSPPTSVSASRCAYGGPAYVIQNIVFNAKKPVRLKLNEAGTGNPSGVLVYNNLFGLRFNNYSSSAYNIDIRNNPNLQTIELLLLGSVENLYVDENPLLVSISAPKLVSVPTLLRLSALGSLTSVDFGLLDSVGSLRLWVLPLLMDFTGFPVLTSRQRSARLPNFSSSTTAEPANSRSPTTPTPASTCQLSAPDVHTVRGTGSGRSSSLGGTAKSGSSFFCFS